MARSYIERTDDETTLASGEKFDSTESFMLGNTDFDAIYNPITSFNFVLEVEALYFLPLKSVKAFTKENEYEYIKEGGVNDYVHMKRKPISKPFTFQVEKYVGTERFLDPLALGTELLLPVLLYVYRHKSRQGLTESAPAYPARIYIFTGCTVISKEYGELNAEQSGIVTETTTIAYRELIVIPNPFQSSSEKEEWEFKKNNEANKKTRYAAFAKNDNPDRDTYPFQYTQDKDGKYHLERKDDDNTEKKVPWTGENGAVPKHAKSSDTDAPGVFQYEQKPDDDGVTHLVRKDTSDMNRPAYSMKKDKGKVKYAKQSEYDKAGETYAITPGKEGQKIITRKDETYLNRAQYELKKDDSKVKYAAQSAIDKAGKTYNVTQGKDGEKTIARKDNTNPLLNKPAWDGSNGVKNKWAKANVGPEKDPVIWPPTRRALMADYLKKQ